MRESSLRGLVSVPAEADMVLQTFRDHCRLRHSWLGFWHRNEHTQDHLVNADRMDHEHRPGKAAEKARQ